MSTYAQRSAFKCRNASAARATFKRAVQRERNALTAVMLITPFEPARRHGNAAVTAWHVQEKIYAHSKTVAGAEGCASREWKRGAETFDEQQQRYRYHRHGSGNNVIRHKICRKRSRRSAARGVRFRYAAIDFAAAATLRHAIITPIFSFITLLHFHVSFSYASHIFFRRYAAAFAPPRRCPRHCCHFADAETTQARDAERRRATVAASARIAYHAAPRTRAAQQCALR